MAAARREAPRGAAGSTWIGVYRRSIPLTASKTAACMMAATREVTRFEVVGGPKIIFDMIWFQSVTTSAWADPARAAIVSPARVLQDNDSLNVSPSHLLTVSVGSESTQNTELEDLFVRTNLDEAHGVPNLARG